MRRVYGLRCEQGGGSYGLGPEPTPSFGVLAVLVIHRAAATMRRRQALVEPVTRAAKSATKRSMSSQSVNSVSPDESSARCFSATIVCTA